MAETIKYRSILQCPQCGFKVTESMPRLKKQLHYVCPACEQAMPLNDQDCCVFCVYGSLPCPEEQGKA